jgi:hypothetical protein
MSQYLKGCKEVLLGKNHYLVDLTIWTILVFFCECLFSNKLDVELAIRTDFLFANDSCLLGKLN